MFSVEKAIFPGIALGCLFLVLVTSLIASPQVALAASQAAPTPTTARPWVVEGVHQDSPLAAAQPTPTEPPTLNIQADPPAEALPTATAEQSSAPQQPAGSSEPADQCAINPGYPDSVQQWCTLISRYSGQNGLDPNLIAAVILQESGGNPNAYSNNGAVGLMQVMPRDGLAAGFMCINGPCFSARPSINELYDPEFNIAYGTQMLAGLIKKYGDVREALHAYGPNNMGYRYADIILSIMQRYR